MNASEIINTLSKFYPMGDWYDTGDQSCWFCGESGKHDEHCIWKAAQQLVKEEFERTKKGQRCFQPSLITVDMPHPLPQDAGMGDYWYMVTSNKWMAYIPHQNDHGGLILADFSNHQVVEHEDGTITVFPSILCKYGKNGEEWHGYLERGVWREV